MCHVSLWSEDGQDERNVVLNPFTSHEDHQHSNSNATYTQVLVGSLVSPCHLLADLNGEKGSFFVFPDVR